MLLAESPIPLVGRAAESRRLAGYVDELVGGRGRAVLVEGEPGIGKSALIRAACDEAQQRGCRILWGSADELGQAFALLPLIDAIGSTDPTWRSEIQGILRGFSRPPIGGADAVIAATERVLATVDQLCELSPVVLVIDDLQWADTATVIVWGRLARAVHQLPLLLLGAARGVPRRNDLAALHSLVRAGDVLRLEGLSGPAVSELVATLCGGRPGAGLLRLAAGAAGNSLYIGELIAALGHNGGLARDDNQVEIADVAVPTTLAEAIGDRLRFLSANARDVLSAAALLGVEFSVADLTVVSGRTVAELLPSLQEARAAGVLIDAPTVLAFRHPLIRAALYEALPGPVRIAWHQDAARTLATAGAPPERVGRQLLAAAGNDTELATMSIEAWVLDWLVPCASMLISQAPAVAIQLLRRSLQSMLPDDDRRGILACRLAEALLWTGDVEHAEEAARQAALRVRDPGLVMELCETLTYCQTRTGRHDEALATLERAGSTPGLTDRHRNRLRILTARQCVALGRLAAAEEVAAEALALADPDDHWTTGWALMTLADAKSMRGSADSLALFERSLAVSEGDPALTGLRLLTLANQADELERLDRLDDAERSAQHLRRLAENAGNVLRVAQSQAILSVVLFHSGRWDDALAEIDAPMAPHFFSHEPYMRGIAAIIALHRGRPAVAKGHLNAADAHVTRVAGPIANLHFLAKILELEHDGDPEKALLMINAALADPTDDIGSVGWPPEAVRLAMLTGEAAVADAAMERARAIGELGIVAHRQAISLHCSGQQRSDPDLLRQAADEYRKAGWVLPRAQAIEAAARIHIARAETGPARTASAEALDLYANLGATWDLARLRADLRAAGIRQGSTGPRRRPAHGWDSLTPTELRIAELVGQGLSNPTIAEQLFLSRRTVQTHVSHLLAKLGQRSRVDIAIESARREGRPR